MLRYPVKLTPDTNDTLMVTCPDFQELVTYGETKEAALHHAIGAFVMIISSRMEDREDVPPPSRGRNLVTLPPMISAKVELYQAMRAQKVTKAELSRRLKWHSVQVDRLLDVDHNSRFEQIEVAFRVLGMKMEVSAIPA